MASMWLQFRAGDLVPNQLRFSLPPEFGGRELVKSQHTASNSRAMIRDEALLDRCSAVFSTTFKKISSFLGSPQHAEAQLWNLTTNHMIDFSLFLFPKCPETIFALTKDTNSLCVLNIWPASFRAHCVLRPKTFFVYLRKDRKDVLQREKLPT